MRSLIILLSILVTAVTTGTVLVGTRTFDGVVVEKPYETGLDWDKAREQRAKLGWSVSVNGSPLRTGKNDLFIGVMDKDNNPLRDAAVQVRMTRPSTNRHDKTYEAVRQADGRYLAVVDLPLYGKWDLIMNITHRNERTEFTKSIFVERSGS